LVLSLRAGWQIEQCKKYKNKICCGIRWPCYNISHATTNQKHAGSAMERIYESRCDQGGVCTGDETIVLGGIRN
jgi:hypothetical protein